MHVGAFFHQSAVLTTPSLHSLLAENDHQSTVNSIVFSCLYWVEPNICASYIIRDKSGLWKFLIDISYHISFTLNISGQPIDYPICYLLSQKNFNNNVQGKIFIPGHLCAKCNQDRIRNQDTSRKPSDISNLHNSLEIRLRKIFSTIRPHLVVAEMLGCFHGCWSCLFPRLPWR